MAKWYHDQGAQSDIVLSTRVRLARNIKGIPFPSRMKGEDGEKVICLVKDALDALHYNFSLIRLSECPDLEKQRLLEAHFISPDMLRDTEHKAVFLSEDGYVSILINEEDHIRLQGIFSGMESEKAYDLIAKIDDCLAERLNYAVHEKYGYLTACPSNAGTGMRLSFMLHLPALCMAQLTEKLFATIGKLGVTVRGLYGEGTKASGYVFQISNQFTLGRSEQELMASITEVVGQIISKERELRTKLLRENGVALEDKIMRAYGQMKYARVMSTKEFNGLLSFVRLGVSAGLIDSLTIREVNTLMVEARPAHVMGDAPLTEMERDVKRADIIRRALEK
ncbi:MAG: protein arginine kinase [Ruminococcaceae bacterium]|nr:protein arginine kinase [Oscillospiraceae bacterium]